MANVTLSPEVRAVLEHSTITANSLKLPSKLDRKLYEAVNKVITLAGGKWNRSAEAHLFAGDPRVKLGLTLATGVAVDEKKQFQFFPTPPELAARVVARLGQRQGGTVLEPSAGQGALVKEVLRQWSPTAVHMIELNPDCLPHLRRIAVDATRSGGPDCTVWQNDFTKLVPAGAPMGLRKQFDVVIMNPPFAKKQDLQHVAHAVEHWLKPGGQLAAIMLPHTEDELLEYVGEHCSFSTEAIEEGAFKSSGTNIKTMLLLLDKDHSGPIFAEPAAAVVVPREVKLPPRPKPVKTQINTRNLQEMLESASNAAQKGQAQYLTPVAWGQALARALPNYRPCITDLTCGHGTLLSGAAGDSTNYLLGCDIDATHDANLEWSAALQARRVTADITRFFPLLQKVDWKFDLGTFNAPWDLHQHRERVAGLADSYCPAVREAFAAHDGRTAQGTIDSTVILKCMALDRMTTYGEAFIIANQATLHRLILAPDAPHRALRVHCWAHLVIEGNICSQRAAGPQPSKPEGTEFRTGILYFARDHYQGFDDADTLRFPVTATPKDVGDRIDNPGFRIARRGARLKPGLADLDSPKLWEAAREEWNVTQDGVRETGGWNILLGPDGNLITNLSTYDTASGRAPKQAADRLFQLNGKHPMHLVMAMASRRELQRAIDGVDAPWRVAPAVIEAVTKAINDYNCARAPLVPLNKIQRLGYIDENETVLCLKDLGPFAAAHRYAIKTETLRTSRSGTKMNLEGSLDDVEYEGSELAIYLSPGGEEQPKLFMEARLMADTVRLSIQDEGEPSPINYTLNQLVDHFEIPDVPDVATLNPEGFQCNLALLAEIEQLVA